MTRLSRRACLLAVGALAATATSIAISFLIAALGPSAVEPALPGRPGQPPYSLNLHPDPRLVVALTALAVATGAFGVGLGLAATARGWSPDARRLLLVGALVAAALTFLPPFGSGDHLSYAAYGRMVVTGHNPYVTSPDDLPADPIARAVEPPWRWAATIYGPLATATQALASWVGGGSVRLTVFALAALNAAAFVAAGLLLHRAAAPDPARQRRVALLWTLNPLLIHELLAGLHVDTLAVPFAVAGLTCRGAFAGGALLGAGAAVKAPVALAAAEPAWRGRHGRRRLAAQAAGFLLVAGGAYLAAGPHVLDQLRRASKYVSLATPWHLLAPSLDAALGRGASRALIGVATLLLAAVLAGLLLRALPAGTGRIAFALTLAWLTAAPYALPWYDATAWALLALLPASAFDWPLLARTTALALAYLPARDPRVTRLPADLGWLIPGLRAIVVPVALTGVLLALVVLAARRARGRAAATPGRSRPAPTGPQP